MKVELELEAEYVDWKEMLEKLNDVVLETTKNISSLEISYSNGDND